MAISRLQGGKTTKLWCLHEVNENIPKLWESDRIQKRESVQSFIPDTLLFRSDWLNAIRLYSLSLGTVILFGSAMHNNVEVQCWLHRGSKAKANPCLWASTAGMNDHLFYVPSASFVSFLLLHFFLASQFWWLTCHPLYLWFTAITPYLFFPVPFGVPFNPFSIWTINIKNQSLA